jgi:hypothetical protein
MEWKVRQQLVDLQLLLDTSTKILPFLESAISETIRLGKTELAKAMLFFVAFDHSYFNHMVLIKQLMRGNSYRDIRKINPFANGRNSLFVQAVRKGNVELANLILDKSLKPNPMQPLLCTNFFNERYRNLEIASRIDFEELNFLDRARLRARLRGILLRHGNCKHVVVPPVISMFILATVFIMCHRDLII